MPTTEQWHAAGLTVEGQLNTFDRRLLSRFRAQRVLNRFGLSVNIPKNGGKSISKRRMEIIWPTGAAATWGAGNASAGALLLTEGTPPALTNATWSEVIATISQYGQVTLISDLAQDQSIDEVTPEYVDNYGDSMTDLLELVTRDALCAGTTVQYASTAASRGAVGSGMLLTYAELRKAKKTLRLANARPVPSEGNKFVVYTHPNAMFNLEADGSILNIWNYAGMGSNAGPDNQMFDVVFKDLPGGFRIYDSTLSRIYASAGLSGADVYATLVLGDEAFMKVNLDSQPPQVITKERGSGGATGDPLNQIASVGWKAAFAAAIVNQANLVRMEHAVA